MAKVSKRFLDRAKPALRRYQKVLESARRRDVNESDTSVIINDMLTEVLGYDKYNEITTELSVRSTFCDLAIKVKGRLLYLIEVKSIGSDLKENHLRQAIEYGAREGIEWIILTNGVCWQAHHIRFEQPIDHDLVFQIDMLDPEVKPNELLEKLYLISREAGNCDAIDLFFQHKEATSRFVIGQLLLNEQNIRLLRRQLRALFPGLRVTDDEIRTLLQAEVLKRDVLEGERADSAKGIVKRAHRRKLRKAAAASEPSLVIPPSPLSS